MKKKLFILLIAFLIVLSFIKIVFAFVKQYSIEELTEISDLIIIGEVVENISTWSNNKITIYTISSININTILKGENPKSDLLIVSEGGEVDKIGLKVSNSPDFRKGEKVLLFLKRVKENSFMKKEVSNKKNGDVFYRTTAMSQGKLRIEDNDLISQTGSTIIEKTNVNNKIHLNILIRKIKEEMRIKDDL